MSRLSMPDLSTVARLGTTVAVLCCLALLLTAASGTVAADIDITIQPAEGEVEEGEERQFEIVVVGATDGVAAHDIEINLADSDVAEMTAIEFVKDPLPIQAEAEVRDGGTTAVGVAAMGDNIYEGADEIAILELTVEGKTLGESTELSVHENSEVGDAEANRYTVEEFGTATVSVVEEASEDEAAGDGTDDSDGFGPGFGIVVALAGLVGAGYLFGRSRVDR